MHLWYFQCIHLIFSFKPGLMNLCELTDSDQQFCWLQHVSGNENEILQIKCKLEKQILPIFIGWLFFCRSPTVCAGQSSFSHFDFRCGRHGSRPLRAEKALSVPLQERILSLTSSLNSAFTGA